LMKTSSTFWSAMKIKSYSILIWMKSLSWPKSKMSFKMTRILMRIIVINPCQSSSIIQSSRTHLLFAATMLSYQSSLNNVSHKS
jgi:hypothetical protein